MTVHRRVVAAGIGALLLAIVTAALLTSGASAQQGAALPREQTLYVTGTMWGPYSDFNPFKNWDS